MIGDWFHVHCKSCGMFGPKAETEEEAVKLWNDRSIAVVPDSVYEKMMESKNGKGTN